MKIIRWIANRFRSMQTFLLSWLAGTGLIASTSVCPYCGNQACAVGIGQATVFGFLIAGVLRLITGKKKKPAPDDNEHIHTDSPHDSHQHSMKHG